jgi:hypothetical protein
LFEEIKRESKARKKAETSDDDEKAKRSVLEGG